MHLRSGPARLGEQGFSFTQPEPSGLAHPATLCACPLPGPPESPSGEPMTLSSPLQTLPCVLSPGRS